MKRFATTLSVLLFSATVLPADDSKPETLVYLRDDAPVFMCVRIEVDGVSSESRWNNYIHGLFSRLDADGDGRLRGDEASGVPTPTELAQMGLRRNTNNSRLPTNASQARLDRYFRELIGGPVIVVVTRPQTATNQQQFFGDGRGGNAAVDTFQKLDADGNGKLSAGEISMSSLRKRDIDDDETISLDELRPAYNPYGVRRVTRQSDTTDQSPPIQHLDATTSATRFVRQLITKYDRPPSGDTSDASRDNKLTPEEIGLPVATFRTYDADGNGSLDFDELRQFLRAPAAAVEITVRLGGRDAQTDVVEGTSLDDSPDGDASGVAWRKTSDGHAAIDFGNVQMEISPQNTPPFNWSTVESSYRDLLKRYDRDNNAYLDKQETDRSVFRNAFKLIDGDGNGQIYETELLKYARRVTEISEAQTTLTVSDRGNGLFQIVDQNQDGRLSVQELASASGKIAAWDADADNEMSRDEIPRHWRLTIARGSSGSAVRVGGSTTPTPQDVQTTAAPIWFLKMDRNNDRGVTRREFLGPASDFREIDGDNDGVLSLAEAVAAQ